MDNTDVNHTISKRKLIIDLAIISLIVIFITIKIVDGNKVKEAADREFLISSLESSLEYKIEESLTARLTARLTESISESLSESIQESIHESMLADDIATLDSEIQVALNRLLANKDKILEKQATKESATSSSAVEYSKPTTSSSYNSHSYSNSSSYYTSSPKTNYSNNSTGTKSKKSKEEILEDLAEEYMEAEGLDYDSAYEAAEDDWDFYQKYGR